MTDDMSESYQWLIAWFRYIISSWYDSDIISVIGIIQTYYQSLVWFRHIISHWYDNWWYVWIIPITDSMSESYQSLILCLNHTNDWWYTWNMPMTDTIPESYQWLILCLNHTNARWYVWIIHMTDIRHNISHGYDSDILSVIGMS
jgi:hypothetical protein